MRTAATWPSHRLFQYERALAERELRVLGAVNVEASRDGVTFDHMDPHSLLARLTYFSTLEIEGMPHVTKQLQAEAVHLSSRGGKQRQATRFGVHGFHEYKGKFNPQLARALINVVDPAAAVVADPFAGSGTALIEALRLGLDAHGRDLSPIAVFMSSAKLKAHTAEDPGAVALELERLADTVGLALKRGQDGGSVEEVSWWTPDTRAYLREWFTPPAIAALEEALCYHPPAEASTAAHLSLLAISSILRDVSLQEPMDLRVRRRPPGFVAPSLRDAYVAATDRLIASLGELEPWVGRAKPTSRLGHADDPDLFRGSSGRRLVVTSPPYATALPYIDTDRLSIMALGMATPAQTRQLEASLTGSREWNQATARRWGAALQQDSHALPAEVMDVLRRVEAANAERPAGFRRAAVPSLLYRYFAAMRADFESWQRQLRPGERAVVVVGRNRTGPRDRLITIDTPRLLAACAEQVGLSLVDHIELETWPRYGIHAENAVEGEAALVVER